MAAAAAAPTTTSMRTLRPGSSLARMPREPCPRESVIVKPFAQKEVPEGRQATRGSTTTAEPELFWRLELALTKTL